MVGKKIAGLRVGISGLQPRSDASLCPPQIKFKQGTVQTPELLQDVEIPESVTVLGQAVDLSALKSALQPVTSSLQSAVEQVCDVLCRKRAGWIWFCRA